MSNFNERLFVNIVSEAILILERNLEGKKDMTMESLDLAINDMLNDEKLVQKYKRENVVMYTSLLKDEINKINFDINYIVSRKQKIVEYNAMKRRLIDQKDDLKKMFKLRNISNVVKSMITSFLDLSKIIVLYLFTVCIIAHLRVRSFIKTCYLYPSNPERFPYMFYDKSDKEDPKNLLSILKTETDSDVDPVFKNKVSFHDNESKMLEINEMCQDSNANEDSPMFKIARTLLGAEIEKSADDKYFSIIQDIVKNINGKDNAEKMLKLSSMSKMFMTEHRDKCKDELSIYSLITFVLFQNTYKHQETIGTLHDGLFKYLTSSTSSISFIALTILLYSIFKNNVNIADRFVNRVLDFYSDKYDGGGKLHKMFVGILASILAPFITFAFLLFLVFYPLSLFNCLRSYLDYINFTNQLSTKIVCYIGIVYSAIGFILYLSGLMLVFFPELLKIILSELRFIMNIDANSTKKKGKNRKKKGKTKENFSGEKSCSGKVGFFRNFNIAKLFGVMLLVIVSIFGLTPIILPFISAFISSFSVSSSLTFDSLKYIKNNMCTIKQYSPLIRIMLCVILLFKIASRFFYGSNRHKWVSIGTTGICALLYVMIEIIFSPTNNYFDELNCQVE